MLKSAIAELPTQTLEQIKNLAQLLACGGIYAKSYGDTRGARLYDDLAVALCAAANPDNPEYDFENLKPYHQSPTFSFEQARAYRDSLIEAL